MPNNTKHRTLNTKQHIPRLLSFLGAFIFIVQTVTAQSGSTWLPTFGPPGGTVHTFAMLGENTVFAGTNRGVYLSLDNGTTWLQRSAGFITEEVMALMVTQTGTLFAGTEDGLYRSTDTGLTWSKLDTGVESPSFTAFTQGGDSLFAGGPQGVIWSIDNGESWESINEGLRDTRIRALAYTQEGDVLAGTEEGVFQLVQLSSEWIEANIGLNRITDRIINTIRRYDERRLLAGTASGVFFSDADSIGWSPTIGEFNGELTENIIDLTIDQAGQIFAATPHIVYKSTDEGINWQSITRGLPAIQPPIQAINALHLNSNNEVLAGTAYYGVIKYVASIEQWQTSTKGLATQDVSSLMLNAFGDLLAGTQTGLFTSSDQGASWNQFIVLEDASGFDLLHQDQEGRLFANGPTLSISVNNGNTWTPIRPDRADAFVVLQDNSFIATTGQSNSVLRSTSDGETWTEVGTIPSQAALFEAYQFLEDNEGRVLIGTEEGLFRSPDNGAEWEQLSLDGRSDRGRSLDKDLTGRIYAGGHEGLYRSDENGDNFVLILEVDSGVVKVLVQDERRYLVLTENEGILRSVDEGASWSPLNDGLPANPELLAGIFDNITIVDGLNAYISVRGTGIYEGRNIIQLSNEESILANTFNVTAYPNPFSENVHISLLFDRSEHISIEIFDMLGRIVSTLHDAQLPSGQRTMEWDTTGLPPGIYFVHVHSITQRSVHAIVKAR